MTPEDLAKIEARWNGMLSRAWTYDVTVEEDIPALIAALKEAWDENEQLKKTIAFWENDID